MTIKINKNFLSQPIVILLIITITLGIGFRFLYLDKKVYWHDEVYTSLRAAGFSGDDIDRESFQNQIIPAKQLQKYQQIKPQSTLIGTLNSLTIENPHHPPLYYFIARLWMQKFGGSLAASRSLPALISLLSLPLIYVLARQLFNSHLTALLATTFLAVSPVEILFAQTARQYSLVTVLSIASSILLLKALDSRSWKKWGLYIVISAVGLYTHLFFCFTLISHGIFVISNWFFSNYVVRISPENQSNLSKFQLLIQTLPLDYFMASVGIIILYLPWIIVVINNLQQAYYATNWVRVSVSFDFLLKKWILSFSCMFIDLDFGFYNIGTYLLRLLFLIIIAWGIYMVCRYCNLSTKLFILTSIFIPFIILVIPDLVQGGKRSAITRYLIPCFPAIYLSVAYLLGKYLSQKYWRVVLGILLTASITSCTVSAISDTWWHNAPSYFNGEVAKKINASDSPILLSDLGVNYTNRGDLISLSYILDDDVRLLLLNNSPNFEIVENESEIFVFRPSERLREALKAKQWEFESVVNEELWKVKNSSLMDN
ncbi:MULTISPECIES: glycosyltransferase family 39 protein [Okeania]|uniref:Glycosyl transferase family 39 n=1 Tax=Okeania hirsuta TaxID=1458930 RepID=A0A3N6NNL4_9CYAN|nr:MULTISPECIES: glycosyltransferase family 39 protein [Okeania]NET15032.1 glycosyl transferase family 39 [Okeania sp. SIO1H6]NES78841.1 glycosyl transferase family 39 [Okeania sp. SIO1H4]NES92503.1 glycosyl transferase family 39 [Okeania sp. SIO2B9]NET22353.1 glycosyl transferase family 39 [Okeania sp. SIO1H5]NET78963.1 glycosyl transferase family 39 [Okeania sp. SIO1F9]